MEKKRTFFLSLFVLVAISAFAVQFLARAEDDEGDDDYQESVVKTIQPASVSTSKTQTTPTTSVSTTTTTLRDSDGDGLLDKDDPHPTIPEIYIVEDNNRNGIVDQFEK
ncbi:MAG: hypothetical protein WC022_02185 [Parcubacteria group bacterium]